MSEIDDIFASKGKSKAAQPIASTSTLPQKKIKKDKKRKREVEPQEDIEASRHKSRPAPQTIIDPSTHIPSLKHTSIGRKSGASKPKPSKPAIQGDDDEGKFKASRGSGPSQYSYLRDFPYVTPSQGARPQKVGLSTRKMSSVYAMKEGVSCLNSTSFCFSRLSGLRHTTMPV
jgi:hypothetical protein